MQNAWRTKILLARAQTTHSPVSEIGCEKGVLIVQRGHAGGENDDFAKVDCIRILLEVMSVRLRRRHGLWSECGEKKKKT